MRIPPLAALLMTISGLLMAVPLRLVWNPMRSAESVEVTGTQPSAPGAAPVRHGIDGAAVATAARSLVGVRELIEDDRRFNFDCSGTVLAAYHRAGIPLYSSFLSYRGSGVVRLHSLSVSRGTEFPAPGDIVFWSNTWDHNGNGRWDDPLTHAGIVTVADPERGDVRFVHHDERRGIVEDRMNLLHPADPTRNAVLRAAGSPDHDGRIYAGQLFIGAGRPYMLAAP